MPLVEYDSSGEESDDDDVNKLPIAEIPEKPEEINTNNTLSKERGISKNESSTTISLQNLPTSSLMNQDIFWDLLSKKAANRSQPIKIFAPEIPEIDPEDKSKKQLKRSTKGSGLIALLPIPKKDSSLMPTQVKTLRKPIIKVEKKSLPQRINKTQHSVINEKKKVVSEVSSLEHPEYEEDDDEGTDDIDLLGLSGKNSEVDPVTFPPVEPEIEASESVSNSVSSSVPIMDEKEINTSLPTGLSSSIDQNNVELDDNALAQLCGSKAKRKREENIELIDVDASSLLSDAAHLHTKDLTVQRKLPNHKKGFGPTAQQRRKHQITYLAFQAKEQELELRNQWASNRMTRKQTQAKYGF